MGISNPNFQKRVLPRKQQQNCCPATGMVQIVATMVNCAETILQLSATDPPLSRRMVHANYPRQNCMASIRTTSIHRSICFVLRVDEAIGDGP